MSTTMLYKDGGTTVVWGVPMHAKVVKNEDIESHIADGWKRHPHDIFEDEEEQEEPVAEEPVAEEPVAEETVAEEPVAEETKGKKK